MDLGYAHLIGQNSIKQYHLLKQLLVQFRVTYHSNAFRIRHFFFPFYIVPCHIKLVKTSWTDSTDWSNFLKNGIKQIFIQKSLEE